MTRYYYMIVNERNKWIGTLLKQDFKNPFYNEIVKKLRAKEYRLKVI